MHSSRTVFGARRRTPRLSRPGQRPVPAFVFGGASGPCCRSSTSTRSRATISSRSSPPRRERLPLASTADEIDRVRPRRPRGSTARRVGLCFDDAWKSLWTVAEPLLQARPDGNHLRHPGAHCRRAARRTARRSSTWPGARALHASGIVDVQSHTHSHSRIFCVRRDRRLRQARLRRRRRCSTGRSSRRRRRCDSSRRPSSARRSTWCARGCRTRARAVSIDVHERCVALVAREGGAAFFARPTGATSWAAAGAGASGAVETDEEQARAIEDELARSRAILNERLKTAVGRSTSACRGASRGGRTEACSRARLPDPRSPTGCAATTPSAAATTRTG